MSTKSENDPDMTPSDFEVGVQRLLGTLLRLRLRSEHYEKKLQEVQVENEALRKQLLTNPLTPESEKAWTDCAARNRATYLATLDGVAKGHSGTDPVLGRLAEWCCTYGHDLCPGAYADTFGEGVRSSKAQVRNILDTASIKPAPECVFTERFEKKLLKLGFTRVEGTYPGDFVLHTSTAKV